MKYTNKLLLCLSLMPFCAAADVTLVSHRITQGLEGQITGSTTSTYDYVSGKDMLIRAVVHAGADILGAGDCIVTENGRSSHYVAGQSSFGSPSDRYYVFSCWVPGSDLESVGVYTFQFAVVGSGRNYSFPLGSGRLFAASKDLRLLVAAWMPPVDYPGHATWDDAFTLNVAEAMAELQRRFPLRAGVSNFYLYPERASTTGLRYYLALPATQCLLRPGENQDAAMSRCDAEARADADFIMRFYNSAMDGRTSSMGYDRFDLALSLTAGLQSWGGQSCRGAQRSTGAWFASDPLSGTSSTVAHEIAHCLGEVQAFSPNSNGSSHARIWDMVLPTGVPLIDMRSRAIRDNPVSLMNGFIANVDNTFLEAFEWNDVRRGLLARSGLLAGSGLLASAERTFEGPGLPPAPEMLSPVRDGTSLFGLTGTVDRSGNFELGYAARVVTSGKSEINADEKSDYAVVFYDKSGKALATHGFVPSFVSADGQTDITGVSLMFSMPVDAIKVAVVQQKRVLQQMTCDGVTPSISSFDVQAAKNGDQLLTWKAWSPAPRPLRYAIEFSKNTQELSIMLAVGLTNNQFVLPARFAPATTTGQFTLTATDGCNTAQAKSKPVFIAARAPLAAIKQGKTDDGHLWFTGIAYDYTDGVLNPGTFKWFLGSRQIGSGERIEVDPATSSNPITLVVTNSQGLQATATD